MGYFLLDHDYTEQDLIEKAKNGRILKVYTGKGIQHAIMFITDQNELIFAICKDRCLDWTYEGIVGELRDIEGNLIKKLR